MPTYQYACTECGEQLEVVQKFSDDPLTVCPSCEGRLRKVFSAVGVVFKGSGFYKTDSRAGGKTATSSSSSSSAGSDSDSGKSDSGKSDSAAVSGTSAASKSESSSSTGTSASSGDGSKVA